MKQASSKFPKKPKLMSPINLKIKAGVRSSPPQKGIIESNKSMRLTDRAHDGVDEKLNETLRPNIESHHDFELVVDDHDRSFESKHA